MDAAGIIKDGMVFQSGAGGISLAAMKYLGERLEEKNVVASTATGGLTKLICDIYQSGRVKNIYYSQVFDDYSVKFIQNNLGLPADIGHYADPTSKGRTIDGLDTVVLGATEVDTSFNVNVNTSGGDIKYGGVSGNAELNTSGGDVWGEKFGKSLNISTSGGDISLIGGDTKINAETSGGDIKLDFKGENKGIDLSTSGGDIAIKLPEDFKASIELSTSGGDVSCSLKLSNVEKLSDTKLIGDLNDGGEKLSAHTSGGDIIVTRR